MRKLIKKLVKRMVGLKQIPRLWGVACSTDFDPERGGGIRNDQVHVK